MSEPADKPGYFLSVTSGFITNSSSVVYEFPTALMEHPEVSGFLAAYGIEKGYLNGSPWDRSQCDAVLVTQEQRVEYQNRLAEEPDYGAPHISSDPNVLVVVHGDEHPSLATELLEVMAKAAGKSVHDFAHDDFN